MEEHAPDMFRSTLTAGVVLGVLASIPYLRLINVLSCYCFMVLLCGFFASYLYSLECQRSGAAFRPGAGASVGMISGAFYALTQTILGTLVLLTVGNSDIRGLLEWLRRRVPQETVEQIDPILAHLDDLHASRVLLDFFSVLLVGALFSTLGGLIGGAVFKRPAASIPTHEDELGPPPML